ncbi:TPA: hypothetical protein TVG27_001693 [Streptococcus equi subsp. zooepidemicus]|uniref:putative mucin/carbohydrate-binding domain-containing protein n=1 Tax=Streptococcus equi TaxID=1336 RepID=UPI0024AE0F5F|nr:putative mucin/carbohydrate-binding domain-containing protein [Streptococcus equi]HEL1015096.1 hypothetical protein [Streptococcus equi subsp. ruminatorum]MDI6000327.1 putative mucin/carbohydrate-binding domain-containing protein [Streptococcus equi subsp. zooepidemicus]WOK53955.1 putative mucin/carbohydrate-binding domain-containing protein [Streptococcus equi subsp. zooepidemicus]WOK55900.1 putative mucin/carbohydrate-binding domain-containing protein [Streptococcus equi subsp. zooepidemic
MKLKKIIALACVGILTLHQLSPAIVYATTDASDGTAATVNTGDTAAPSAEAKPSQLMTDTQALFTDHSFSKLASNVTQEKIDALKQKATASTEPEKEQILGLLDKAASLLQQFTLQGLGNGVFAQLYFYADGSYTASLVTKKGQPHSYFSTNYATVTILNDKKETVYSKEYVGNVSQVAQTEELELKEGYYLIINKQEPNRFYTNHNDALKQNNTNPYTYVVRDGQLERIDDSNRTLRFLGLGNAEYATLRVDYNASTLTLKTKQTKPHVYFSGSYEKLEVLDTENQVIYTKDFIGTQVLEAKTETIPFKVGYKIRLTGSEHHTRVKFYDDYAVEAPLTLSKNQATLKLLDHSLELMRSKTGSELESEVLTLFTDESTSKLASNVTQEKIDALRQKVTASTEPEKEQILSLLDKAASLLQQFTLQGLGNGVFAQLYFYADGSYTASLVTKKGQPHSYIANNYATLTILNDKKETVYAKEYVGNVSQTAKTESLTLKEGYYLVITKQEPNRFYTNHNDALKQNNTNPYTYVVRNGQLERIDEKNRTLHFLGLGNAEYATLKVDYNASTLTLKTKKTKPHVYFSGTYEKLEVLDLKDKVVYTQDFIGNQVLTAKTETIPFKVGYKIRLTGSEHHTRVKAYDEENKAVSLSLPKNKAEIRITKGGLASVFALEAKATNTLVQAVEKRLTKEKIEDFKKKDNKHKAFIDWLLKDNEAMQLYLGAGYAHSAAQGGMSSYQFKNTYNLTNELEALELWFKIWDKYETSHQGIQLKMAIAVALEFNKPVGAWYNESRKIDPLERFATFAEAEQGNVLFEDFYSLTVEQIRNVVNAKITDEDMKWLRQYVETNKPAMINRNDITKGYSLISYVGTNPETGVSVHSSGFYGPNPTIKEVIKYGGVCGAMSKLSSVLAQAYGVPAFPIGQPGHCAYIYLNADHTYQLGYDVSGWTGCGNYNTTLPYVQIHNVYSLNIDAYNASEYERYKAEAATDKETKLNHLDAALKAEPLNYKAWNDKLALVASDQTAYQSTLNDMKSALKDYPVIINNLEKDTKQ